jgi:hypothetical protein
VGFFLLAGCSLESYVSRYDGEIGGGKEERKNRHKRPEKKTSRKLGGQKRRYKLSVPVWQRGWGRSFRAPASSNGRDRSTRETFVQPI